MPSLRQIEYLVALAETRHFRRAAERVGVSQPTLSAQLCALEERLGVQLVERSRTKVLITPVGEQILVVARRMLRDAQEMRDLAASQRGDLAGTLRLGLPPTIGPHLLPKLLPELHRTHPLFKIYVREDVPARLPSALADGVYDAVLTPLPIQSADLEVEPLFREKLFVAVQSDHRLAVRGAVTRADLTGETVLALERGHQLHEQVEAICEEFGATLDYDYEGTSLETLTQMTALGMGLSFLPGLFVESSLRDREGVAALEMKDRNLYRTLGVAWRKTSTRTRDFEILIEYFRTTIDREFRSATVL